MPLEVNIWKIDQSRVSKIDYSSLESEKKLEDIIENDIGVLSDDLLIIGRQVPTSHGKSIDLLAIGVEGKVSIIELKRNKTPREVVAQILDYASWIQTLSYSEIKEIFSSKNNGEDFDKIFDEKFGTSPPEKINQDHDMVIVASELDSETERIINYLSDNYNVPINVVFFRYFKDGQNEYLSRSWLIDPNEVIEKASKSRIQSKGEIWNGKDFAANIDVSETGTWEDCIKYSYISAGGGKWYYRSLNQLFPGARVFCMIPKGGYVGVGNVKEIAVPIKDFYVEHEGKKIPILEAPVKAQNIGKDADKLELCPYMVAIDWIKTVPVEKAYWAKGLRANQNSAFKLKSSFTLDKLTKFFDLEE